MIWLAFQQPCLAGAAGAAFAGSGHGDAIVKIRGTPFEPGRYPASALLTVSNFARPGIVLEIQGVAVVAE